MLRVLVWLIVLGALLYTLFWVLDRRSQLMARHTPGQRKRSTGPGERPHRHTRQGQGPIGPDDDEEFLRELDRRRRGD